MHEKNIALLCDEADRLLQLNINLLRQMVDEPDVLSDSKNENRLLFDKQKALKRIEELEGEQIKTARREMVLAVVGTMKAGKSTTINAIVGQEILPNRNRPMTSVPTLIRHVPGKTEPVLHLEHIQPVRNLLSTLQQKLDTPAGQQVAQTLQQAWAEQPGACPDINTLYTDDATYKAAIDKALKPVGLDGLFGKDGVMNGPGGDVIPVQINGKIWLESTACKSNACGWEYITTLYNPQTHVVVGYYYNVDPGYLVWFGDIGVNEFAYLVKKYVATVN